MDKPCEYTLYERFEEQLENLVNKYRGYLSYGELIGTLTIQAHALADEANNDEDDDDDNDDTPETEPTDPVTGARGA